MPTRLAASLAACRSNAAFCSSLELSSAMDCANLDSGIPSSDALKSKRVGSMLFLSMYPLASRPVMRNPCPFGSVDHCLS